LRPSSNRSSGQAQNPLPDSIPVDGSTIQVWVDGLPLGHPDDNNYRGDIASLFPGYANSNGAVGVYTLNTELLADGVHTIAWSVQDSNGDVDGIGSRYFTVTNLAGGSSPGSAAAPQRLGRDGLSGMAEARRTIAPGEASLRGGI